MLDAALPMIPTKRLIRIDKCRAELLACAKAVARLATHRKIEPVLAGHVIHDLEIRQVLATIVRRWTIQIKPSFVSTGAANRPRAEQHQEHVVPVRVLVDRMIMRPRECRRLLDTALIIASVTPAEHQRLGGIYTHFPDLYRRMLAEDVSHLPRLGKQRYRRKRIKLHRRQAQTRKRRSQTS